VFVLPKREFVVAKSREKNCDFPISFLHGILRAKVCDMRILKSTRMVRVLRAKLMRNAPCWLENGRMKGKRLGGQSRLGHGRCHCVIYDYVQVPTRVACWGLFCCCC
jgi:hypothetical protein